VTVVKWYSPCRCSMHEGLGSLSPSRRRGWGERTNVYGRMCAGIICKYYTIFYIGDLGIYLMILVSTGAPRTSAPWVLQDGYN
jgi:hypothetical protein